MTEAQIEEMILQYLAYAGWWGIKVPTTGYHDGTGWRKQASKWCINGFPDVLAMKEGKILFFEIKTPVGRQSDAQKAFEKRLHEYGHNYFLVRSVEDVKKVINDLICG